eukprot:CAMPEP_0177736214 /NCGR_PEP_ID=MMETSP0484_2-20121128/25207_1 /TAXON_ID=354590 /ORGANISM="Rhodomonas lens, Strain RHODO" /LENGTH=229 /DNA_ID=CAMNT_0019249863 /DNA_START=133 /DNA_END=819 /DNA_ORIENTATION=-
MWYDEDEEDDEHAEHEDDGVEPTCIFSKVLPHVQAHGGRVPMAAEVPEDADFNVLDAGLSLPDAELWAVSAHFTNQHPSETPRTPSFGSGHKKLPLAITAIMNLQTKIRLRASISSTSSTGPPANLSPKMKPWLDSARASSEGDRAVSSEGVGPIPPRQAPSRPRRNSITMLPESSLSPKMRRNILTTSSAGNRIRGLRAGSTSSSASASPAPRSSFIDLYREALAKYP